MWMNNPWATSDDEDNGSWEVKAFEEDASNVLGVTWPPSSYTCTFCMREFRSAQALGGHMNVHRRDRERLHHQPPPVFGGSNNIPARPSSSSPNLIIPTHQHIISSNTGGCFLYSLPNPHGLSPTSLLNKYSYNSSNYPPICATSLLPNYPTSAMNYSATFRNDNYQENNDVKKDSVEGEIDLELRLGYKSSASSSSYTP